MLNQKLVYERYGSVEKTIKESLNDPSNTQNLLLYLLSNPFLCFFQELFTGFSKLLSALFVQTLVRVG